MNLDGDPKGIVNGGGVLSFQVSSQFRAAGAWGLQPEVADSCQ